MDIIKPPMRPGLIGVLQKVPASTGSIRYVPVILMRIAPDTMELTLIVDAAEGPVKLCTLVKQ